MVYKWRAAARALGSNKSVVTDSAQRLWPINTQPCSSVSVCIVHLWFSCVTPKIISQRILELSQFTSCSVSIFKHSSVLTCMGPYLFSIHSTTWGAFRIQSLDILLAMIFNSEYNWILIHTALYVSVGITISTNYHSPAVLISNTWHHNSLQICMRWYLNCPNCKRVERDL